MAVKSKRRHIGRYILLLFIIGIVGGEIFRRNAVKNMNDTFLQTYQPKPEVAEIAEKTTLTDKAKILFYRADPEFIESNTFAEYCITKDGIQLALACARSNTPGQPNSTPRIFLLQMDNPKFADSRFPSAAHEMLHLVYQKLTNSEKQQLAPLIDTELTKHEDDAHLMNIVDIIKNSMGDKYLEEMRNELHSIFGIEFQDISPELEDYYSQYFSDRTQVVTLHQNGGLEQSIRKLDELTWERNQLNDKIQTLREQDPDNVTEYNNLVNQYNVITKQGQVADKEMQALYKLINPSYTP